MSASLSCFRPTPIIASAASSSNHRSKPSSSSSSPSQSWWTPLFGWSSDPDYILPNNSTSNDPNPPVVDVSSESALKQTGSRFYPGCFTEEKAKQLRIKTIETASFHDKMYHSAIASRLASDLSNRHDG